MLTINRYLINLPEHCHYRHHLSIYADCIVSFSLGVWTPRGLRLQVYQGVASIMITSTSDLSPTHSIEI